MLALKCNCSNDNLFTFSCNDALSMKGLAKLQCFNGSENWKQKIWTLFLVCTMFSWTIRGKSATKRLIQCTFSELNCVLVIIPVFCLKKDLLLFDYQRKQKEYVLIVHTTILLSFNWIGFFLHIQKKVNKKDAKNVPFLNKKTPTQWKYVCAILFVAYNT